MRSIKHIALSIILTLGVFGAVLYTSCSKSACKGVTCLNGATCSGGICQGCPNGIGGNNCEIVYRQLYNHTYDGFATYYNQKVRHDSVFVDSSYVIRVDTGNTLTFMSGNDSVYTQTQMTWSRPGQTSASTTIVLANNTANGSSFTTLSTFQIDTFSCTGSGTISGSNATLNIIATPPHSPAILITLNNLAIQK